MIASRCYLLFLGGLTSLASCQPTSLPAEALGAYVADPAHKLHQVQHVGETEVSVTYQPVDLLVSRELPEIDNRRTTLDSLRHKYYGSTFFLLSIAHNGQEVLQPREGFTDYSELLQTLAFRMDNYVCLTTSKGDTLRPTNYYLDRTYASANASQLLFAFPSPPATGIWRFQLRECGLGTGNLSFAFDTKQVVKAPTLPFD